MLLPGCPDILAHDMTGRQCVFTTHASATSSETAPLLLHIEQSWSCGWQRLGPDAKLRPQTLGPVTRYDERVEKAGL